MRLHRILGATGLVIAAVLAIGAGTAFAAPSAPALVWSSTPGAAPAPGLGSWAAYRPASGLSPLLPAAGPTVTGTAPSISGSATVGSTLNADAGQWTSSDGSTITYTYTWEDCDPSGSTCNPNGTSTSTTATTTTYQVASSDVGSTIEVQVTAADDTGSSSPVSSQPTAVVPGPPVLNSGGAPSITGNATVGGTLNASNGSWTNSPTSYDYQWESCSGSVCAIVGADSPSYTVSPSDIGNTIEVGVTANNSAGSSSLALSNPTSAIPGPPTNSVRPSISPSNPTVGTVLTATTGSWSGGALPVSYSYQWESCATSTNCSNVGGNSSTYTVGPGDVGHTLVVVVTATDSSASPQSNQASSAPTAAVPGAPVKSISPSISGTAAQGQTLTANPGSWTNSPTSYSYQWESCTTSTSCSPVGGNSNTYTLASTDVGHTMVVVVTASNSAGASSPATSAPTPVVVGPPAIIGGPAGAPSINGSASVGSTLSVNNGNWSYSPTFSYQWWRCPKGNPASCYPLNYTQPTYAVGPADVNASLQVVVTAANAAGSVSVTVATGIVPALPGYPTALINSPSYLLAVPATGSPVTFTSGSTAYGSNSLTGYSWDFGDGTSGSGASVTHTYSAAARYLVTLTVTQSDGLTAQDVWPLTVYSPPTSAFTWSPNNPTPGATVAFSNASSAGTGTISSYSWSFGDGTTSNTASPTHTYGAAGSYTVTLTVQQADGLTATVQHTITVAAPAAIHTATGSLLTATKRWLAGALVLRGSPRIGTLLKKNGTARVIKAPTAAGRIAITWYATTHHHRIVVARGSARLRAHKRARIAIKLTRAGRRLLAKSHWVTLTVSGSFHYGAGHVSDSYKVTVNR